jgi:SAM-dependent methyltransferase
MKTKTEELLARPWPSDSKIPWNDPAFSARMLREHLSQDHDAASRRLETVEAHVSWIHESVLRKKPTRVLDLGCGPGLYATRLARRGHDVTGIDYSPASIKHARASVEGDGLACVFIEGDVTEVDLGGGFDLAMMIFGEINAFDRDTARALINRAHESLAPGGTLLLEPSLDSSIRDQSARPTIAKQQPLGLFSDRPHFYIQEHRWLEDERVAQTRFITEDSETGQVHVYGERLFAWTEDEYCELLTGAGFSGIAIYPSLSGEPDVTQRGLFAITATA